MMKKLLSLLLATVVLLGASAAFAQTTPVNPLPGDIGQTLWETIFNSASGNIDGDDIEAILGTTTTILGAGAAAGTGTYYNVAIPPATITEVIPTITTTNPTTPANTNAAMVTVRFTGILTGMLATQPHVALAYGESPAAMTRVRALYSSNQMLNPGQVRTFSKDIRLKRGTTYYFYAFDAEHGITYPVQSFKTSGTAPANASSPVESGHTVLNPSGASFAIEVWGTLGQDKTSLTLKGRVIPLQKQGINLKLSFGTSSSNLADVGTVLTRSMLYVGDESRDAATRKKLEFSHTFTNLAPKTQYYFQLTDTVHNIKYPIKSFTIPDPSDPEDDSTAVTDDTNALVVGVLDDAVEIENPYAEKGLVPCGGKGQEMCTFRDFLQLVGNVIDYIFLLAIPIIAIMCVYTGIDLIINRNKSEELSLAKSRMLKVGIGLAVIFLAFAGISSLYKALKIPGDYILLDVLGNNNDSDDNPTATTGSCDTATVTSALSASGYTKTTKINTVVNEKVDSSYQAAVNGVLLASGLTGNSTVGEVMTKFGISDSDTLAQAATKANLPSSVVQDLCQ